LSSIKDLIGSCQKAYLELSDKFIVYLKTVRSFDSENEESSHKLIRETVVNKANLFVRRIDYLMNSSAASQTLSHRSRSSRNSNVSYVDKKEAELRAAVVEKRFLEEETKILHEKAYLESRLKAIKVEEEIQTKEAEIQALKQQFVDFHLPTEDPALKTQYYVDSLQGKQHVPQ
jgi:hypothetical protein